MLLFAGMVAMSLRAPVTPVFANTIVAAGCIAVLTSFMVIRFHNRALEYFGKISYGLYVFHTLTLSFSQAAVPPNTLGHWALSTMLALLATSCLAAASYKWLEQPFLALKNRFAWVISSATLRASQ
jgi:peptidoglycan/LPS O-acetylase OafA/YrhL